MSQQVTQAQMELARRLLAYEASHGDADGTTAASRVYDKLHRELATLLGDAGVHSLFMRSARLAQAGYTGLAAASVIESSSKLREWLQEQDHTASDDMAALFANLIALLTTFVGDRLTTQALQRAWPTLEEVPGLNDVLGGGLPEFSFNWSACDPACG